MNPIKIFQDELNEIPDDVKKEVDWSFAIADRIETVLNERKITHKEWASQIGKTEAEVSRWVSGTHNFTLRTLAKISVALGEDLIKLE
ncbi:MAG: helix-turn-helix transcriptional regulator [Bacteroidales bacterium]|nr:helix-turn-helix transcriptional regulator [Bacteroidales bacterium]